MNQLNFYTIIGNQCFYNYVLKLKIIKKSLILGGEVRSENVYNVIITITVKKVHCDGNTTKYIPIVTSVFYKISQL